MNPGLMAKSVREVWVGTLLFAMGAAIFECLLARILPTFYEELSGIWLEVEFIKSILTAILGADIAGTMGQDAMLSMALAHPVLLTLVCAQGITFCTRMPAGEVDRGTIDVMFSLNVSRTCIYLSETAVWLACGVSVVMMALVGNIVGGWSVRKEAGLEYAPLLIVAANLYCLAVAAGGISFLVSSLSDSRGRAVGVIAAVLLSSLVLNLLEPFNDTVKDISFLGILNYYRPFLILRDPAWPIGDIAVLLTIGGVSWLAGLLIFNRRDLCTV